MIDKTNLQEKVDDVLPYTDAPVGVGGWLLVLFIWLFIMSLYLGYIFRSNLVIIQIAGNIKMGIAWLYSPVLIPVFAIFFSIISKKYRAIRGLKIALYWVWFYEMISIMYTIGEFSSVYIFDLRVNTLTLYNISSVGYVFSRPLIVLIIITVTVITISLSRYLSISKRIKNTFRN